MENKVRYLRLNSSKSRNKSDSWISALPKAFLSVRYLCVYIKPVGIIILTSLLLWFLFNLKAKTGKEFSSHVPYYSGPRYFSESFASLGLGTDTPINSVKSKNYTKILFWTPYYGKRDLGFQYFTCPGNRQCEVTFNQNDQEDADVLLFNAVDLQIEKLSGKVYAPKYMPSNRNPNVPWIIALFESPEHVLVDLRVFHGVFNWTWSFRQDADVHGRQIYQRLEDSPDLQSVENVKGPINIQNKTKLAAWIVSNCDLQPSNRNYLVKLLRKYIPIDVYGECGRKSCSTSTGFQCYEEIAPNYKFYLSFENSLCVDYTTEKFSSALDAGMVPVVYGFGNITEPKGSFINAFNYDTVEQLAKYLLHLDSNRKEYAKYFEWRKLYGRIPQNSFLCDVCEKVGKWREEKINSQKPGKAIEFLWDWWVHTNNSKGQKIWACSRPGYHLRNLRKIFLTWWLPYKYSVPIDNY